MPCENALHPCIWLLLGQLADIEKNRATWVFKELEIEFQFTENSLTSGEGHTGIGDIISFFILCLALRRQMTEHSNTYEAQLSEGISSFLYLTMKRMQHMQNMYAHMRRERQQ